MSSRIIRASSSHVAFGVGPMASRAAKLLRERGEKVATIEMTSGGLINAALLSLPGASRYFCGPGTILYGLGGKKTSQAVRALLNNDEVFSIISDPRYKAPKASAEEYIAGKEIFVRSLADHMRERLGADWCLVESGATGPTFNVAGVERAFCAAAVAGPVSDAVLVEAPKLDREANMRLFAESALNLLADCLQVATHGQATSENVQFSAAQPIRGVLWWLDQHGDIVAEVQAQAVAEPSNFLTDLDAALSCWSKEGSRRIWMQVPMRFAACVPELAARDFVYHHAQNDNCVLVR